MLFSKALEGFLFFQRLGNHSPATLEWYTERLTALQIHLYRQTPDCPIERVTKADVAQFISSLQSRQTIWGGDRFHKEQARGLSIYTIHGYVRALSTFFRWAAREKLIPANPMEGLPRPKLPKSIKPRFDESDIKRLLATCAKASPALAARNRAIILLLLDSGLRASELVTLRLDYLDPELRRAHVTGKGMKDRYVPIGNRTKQALWMYVNRHRPQPLRENYVFLGPKGFPLTANKLAHILTKLGERGGIKPCNPHRFRHTMARLYLRNGGDVMSLQQILGHEDLATTRIYVQLEREDIERTHERASPVDRWAL